MQNTLKVSFNTLISIMSVISAKIWHIIRHIQNSPLYLHAKK